jgi:ADP-ribose pyrophosphatase YjhB (NUDIX family)
MRHPGPEFGLPVRDVVYVDRPGAYAILLASGNLLALVRGKADRLYLPDGGLERGEPPDAGLLREMAEKIRWRARILSIVGHATQFLSADGEGYFAIRATYFRTGLIERCAGHCEHEMVWLAAAAAMPSLARESDAWAISRACNSK